MGCLTLPGAASSSINHRLNTALIGGAGGCDRSGRPSGLSNRDATVFSQRTTVTVESIIRRNYCILSMNDREALWDENTFRLSTRRRRDGSVVY